MSSTVDEVVDAEIVGTEMVEHVAPASLFRTDDPVEVLDKASQVATALAQVIDRQGMFVKIRGKNHVTIDGWQTLGSMLGVTAVVTSTGEVADGDWEARAEARTLDGRVVGAADAMCCKAEGGNWGPKATSNARRAMAQTRAMSRALRGPLGFVVTLAGYQATAAEEMPTGPAQPEPVTTDKVTDEQAEAILSGLMLLQDHGVKAGMFLASQGAMVDKQSLANTVRSLPAENGEHVCGWISEQLDKVQS